MCLSHEKTIHDVLRRLTALYSVPKPTTLCPKSALRLWQEEEGETVGAVRNEAASNGEEDDSYGASGTVRGRELLFWTSPFG